LHLYKKRARNTLKEYYIHRTAACTFNHQLTFSYKLFHNTWITSPILTKLQAGHDGLQNIELLLTCCCSAVATAHPTVQQLQRCTSDLIAYIQLQQLPNTLPDPTILPT
jgi:hypothetical protein